MTLFTKVGGHCSPSEYKKEIEKDDENDHGRKRNQRYLLTVKGIPFQVAIPLASVRN
jgi:hypothetical protein